MVAVLLIDSVAIFGVFLLGSKARMPCSLASSLVVVFGSEEVALEQPTKRMRQIIAPVIRQAELSFVSNL